MRTAQSSHLEAHGYDPETRTLTVRFANGAVYQYAGVPETVADTLVQSGGGGTYFWSKIRGQYPTVKIVEPGSRRRKR